MSELHLTTGSVNPPLCPNKLRLYSMKFCPYAARVRLVLLAKNIDHDVVNVNLKMKPEWLTDLNPTGQVPILVVGKTILTESVDICSFLDKTYPEPPLFPGIEPFNEEYELIEKFNKICTVFYAAIRTLAKPLQEYLDELLLLLKPYEEFLSKTDGPFFGGKNPSMVDYMLWPFGERWKVMEHAFNEKLTIDETILPNIFKWCSAMRELDCVKKTIISSERLWKVTLFHKPGVVADYDNI